MAISIRHDAAGIDPKAIEAVNASMSPAGIGINSGGGKQRSTRRNLVLDGQKAAQDNLRRMQDRMFEIGKMNMANQFQAARDNRMIQADQNMLKFRQQAENEQFMARRKFQQQDLEAAIQRDIEQQTTRGAEAQIAEIRGMMSKQKYTPVGQELVGTLMGELRSIEAKRDSTRPKGYNALLNQWLDKADRAGLQNFVAAPPTIDDAMSTNFKDLGNGYGVLMQPDGKMEIREIDPMKAAANKGGGAAAMSAADYFADDSKYESAKKRALQTLENSATIGEDGVVPTFSAEQIHEQMLKDFNEHQGFLQQLGGNQTGGQGQTGGQNGGQAAPQQSQPPAANTLATPPGRKEYKDMTDAEKAYLQHLQNLGSGGQGMSTQAPSGAPAQPVATQPVQQQPVSPQAPQQAPQQAAPQQIVSDDTLNTLAAQNSQGQQPMSLNEALVAFRAGRMSAEQITEMLQSGRLADNDGKVVNKLPDWFTKPNPATGWPGFLQDVKGNPAAEPKAVAETGDNLSPNGQAAVQAGDNTPAIVSRIAAENLRRAKEGMYAGSRDEQGRVSAATPQDVTSAFGKAGASPSEMQNMMGPEAMAMMQQYGSQNPGQDLQNFWTNFLTPSMPKPAKAAKVTDIKDPVSRTQAAMLPRPKSMKELHEMYEAGKIKPGGMFIAPDGTMQKYNPPQDQSAAG